MENEQGKAAVAPDLHPPSGSTGRSLDEADAREDNATYGAVAGMDPSDPLTTDPATEDEEEFQPGISLPPRIVEPAVPGPLVGFEGWHRPRKQWVRTRQWRGLTERLLATLRRDYQGHIDHELRYLTLPGADMLDVETLGALCQQMQVPLNLTGFLASEEGGPVQGRAKTRVFSLVSRKVITSSSILIPERLEGVSKTTTQAYKDFGARGPYHVVNIDACGPLASTTGHSNRIIDAIHGIVEYQIARCAHPWLLFLTTIVQLDSLDATILNKFQVLIRQNAEHDPSFSDAALAALNPEASGLEEALTSSAEGDGPALLRLFCVGFGKWLHHMVAPKGWTVKMHMTCFYATRSPGPDAPNMPSLAFEIIPPALGTDDPSGIVRPAAGRPTGPQINPIIRIAEKVAAIVDVDLKLEADAGLQEELTADMISMLEMLGYQNFVERYRTWLQA